MNELDYPFNGKLIRRKKKFLKKELLKAENLVLIRVAILGGSTTSEVKDILELFLLNYGFLPKFYESEYAQYWQDAMFDNDALSEFKPEIIYIHTSNRNISSFPEINADAECVDALIDSEYKHYSDMWNRLSEVYKCIIIQNNFEYPFYRLLGNKDVSDFHGKVNYVCRLNLLFSEYAQSHEKFYINDINYQSAVYGLKGWNDLSAWHMYKYALSQDAIPILAYNIANIIKSLYGKNKKALALDLDNTLWGGVVGDDGVENLELGQETPMGQIYTEFQDYLKELQSMGILLNVISKNDEENAKAGISHPQMLLKEDDFISIKANWNPKSENLVNMASELSLLPESFVFVDDNPAEREIVRQQVPGIGIPELDTVESYIRAIDGAGYFEATVLSGDDIKRSRMYKENAQRAVIMSSFENYSDYLLSLEMTAEIQSFQPIYMSRIAQLTNKSNQFNLTTRRFSQGEIEQMAGNPRFVTLYGKLEDKFGDNGVVSVVIGEIADKGLDIILWLMSCRALKRDMEFAMMDELVEKAVQAGIKDLYGYYYPTKKNSMVKDFYKIQGFEQISIDESGNSAWRLNVEAGYEKKNNVIRIKR